MSIIDYFPFPEIRPGQEYVLKWLECNWNKYDVFVLEAPVACGKSAISITLGRWLNKEMGSIVGITTPTNVLVNQYKREFSLPSLPYASQFAGGDLFRAAVEKFKQRPLKVMNNYTLLSSRVYSDVQIMDEAHELIPMLQDFEGITLWQHLDYYPDNIRTVSDLLIWAATQNQNNKKIKKLTKLLSKNPIDYVVSNEEEIYRGKPREKLRIYPLTPKHNRPILWPPAKVKKIVLMSATIAKPDIEDLGLHNRRVGYVSVPSDIPKENRPWSFKGMGSMGNRREKESLAKALAFLDKCEQEKDGRGFVHSTYNLAAILQGMDEGTTRTYHGTWDKKKKLDGWLGDLEDQNTFIGCGLTTGLDLKGELCRWQAILKCPFPDLGDPAVYAKAMQNKEWYAWSVVKEMAQAYGRVCRGPDDYGMTYILDSDFARLYSKYQHLFPVWFREAFVP